MHSSLKFSLIGGFTILTIFSIAGAITTSVLHYNSLFGVQKETENPDCQTFENNEYCCIVKRQDGREQLVSQDAFQVGNFLFAFFLGEFGVNWFYIGHVGIGIAKLCATVGILVFGLLTILSKGFLIPAVCCALVTGCWWLADWIIAIINTQTTINGCVVHPWG